MRLAVAQIVSSADLAANLELIREYATRAKAAGAELVVFPEAAMCAFGNPLADIAEPLDGPWATAVRAIAAELDIAVVVGMFTPGEGGRVRNTLLVTGPGIDTSYDKIHLFDAFGFAESDSVDAGTAPVTFELNGTAIGLATCYDVRFPALFTANARAGAAINIVCASWGAGEGKAEQWDLLVRARAVDSTTFVVACGQGDPATTRASVRRRRAHRDRPQRGDFPAGFSAGGAGRRTRTRRRGHRPVRHRGRPRQSCPCWRTPGVSRLAGRFSWKYDGGAWPPRWPRPAFSLGLVPRLDYFSAGTR